MMGAIKPHVYYNPVTEVVKTYLLMVHLGLPFCLTSLCLTQLGQKFGNGLLSPLHFPKK